jgi:hypothetical protein
MTDNYSKRLKDPSLNKFILEVLSQSSNLVPAYLYRNSDTHNAVHAACTFTSVLARSIMNAATEISSLIEWKISLKSKDCLMASDPQQQHLCQQGDGIY